MIKIVLIQIAVTIAVYIMGVLVGMKVAQMNYEDSELQPADFDDDLITHVGYDDEQCGYTK